MIGEVVHQAHAAGRRLAYWAVGGGFDARWYRLRPSLKDVVTLHGEIEAPEVLAITDAVLTDSSLAAPWERVRRVGVTSDRWALPNGQQDVVVVLEGVATRLGITELKRMLRRLRADAPQARVIVDLPGLLEPTDHPSRAAAVSSLRSRWASPAGTTAEAIGTQQLLDMGGCLHEDHSPAARPELCSASGIATCSGMEACRVVHLGPAQ